MKKYRQSFVYLIVFIALCLQGLSQGITGNDAYILSKADRDIKGRPVGEFGSDIQGTAFYSSDWTTGLVLLSSGKLVPNLPLRFNVYNNKLYFQQDQNQLEFVAPISAFYLGSDTNTAVLFRNGYMPIDKNGTDTYYEVLAKGKVQLLKYRQKIIREETPMNMPKVKRFEDVDLLYVSLPDHRIEKIKRNKNDVLKALPEYADVISKILDEEQLNLKQETGLIMLFKKLNEQLKG